jgi:hypothetical protein
MPDLSAFFFLLARGRRWERGSKVTGRNSNSGWATYCVSSLQQPPAFDHTRLNLHTEWENASEFSWGRKLLCRYLCA